MSGHRYWRLKVLQRAGNGLNSFFTYDIGMYTGSTNHAPGATVTTSSGANASNIKDGNSGTTFSVSWSGIASTGLNIDWDFGSPVDIDKITFGPDSSFATFFSWGLVYVQHSDDNSTWTTQWIIHTPSQTYTWSAGTKTFTRPSDTVLYDGVGRYWLVTCDSNVAKDVASSASYSANECEMRESAGGADATGSGSAFSLLSSSVANLFDNSNTSAWLIDYTTFAAFGYDFGSGVTKGIRQIMLRAPASGNVNSMPTRGLIAVSDNRDTYWAINEWAAPSWSLGQLQALSTFNPPLRGRRRQMRIGQ